MAQRARKPKQQKPVAYQAKLKKQPKPKQEERVLEHPPYQFITTPSLSLTCIGRLEDEGFRPKVLLREYMLGPTAGKTFPGKRFAGGYTVHPELLAKWAKEEEERSAARDAEATPLSPEAEAVMADARAAAEAEEAAKAAEQPPQSPRTALSGLLIEAREYWQAHPEYGEIMALRGFSERDAQAMLTMELSKKRELQYALSLQATEAAAEAETEQEAAACDTPAQAEPIPFPTPAQRQKRKRA